MINQSFTETIELYAIVGVGDRVLTLKDFNDTISLSLDSQNDEGYGFNFCGQRLHTIVENIYKSGSPEVLESTIPAEEVRHVSIIEVENNYLNLTYGTINYEDAITSPHYIELTVSFGTEISKKGPLIQLNYIDTYIGYVP